VDTGEGLVPADAYPGRGSHDFFAIRFPDAIYPERKI
jgi:hypothetical protein